MPLPSTPSSICIMRLSAIGDVCHAVAMVQALQRRHPQASITWVVGKVEASLLEGLPGVELVVFDKSRGWEGYRALWRTLRGRRFDVLLHMQVALRASIATLGIRAKIRIGFDRARAKEGQWLFTNHRIQPQAEPHVLDGFMNFARELGVTDTTPRWQMPLSEQDLAFALERVPQGQRTLIICPAASKGERNWLPQRYAAVADHAASRGLAVMLCGGPAPLEKRLAEEIQHYAETEVTNLVGQTSLKQLLALLGRATLVLAPDTGPAHMAVTQDTPVVGLYAHSNPGRTGPYSSRDLVVSAYQAHVETQQGKPLAEIPWGTRAKGQELMHAIEVDAVIAKVDALLTQA
ncbi:glycosyltransferase family 9 protein [Ferrimonas sediminicola]|uniref:Glycosyltransferase family 9 protein n=1 Tax=Ferrimonas sediminicola TaxID=2569538 RepID=A0A4V5NWN8_9GAMM|nr:glycosyltransferase family 9 protein [Ferrimonas sediminicola]TKB47594.1 glycosyltransferase family 9 protein [Ferrimonas sediminicola]